MNSAIAGRPGQRRDRLREVVTMALRISARHVRATRNAARRVIQFNLQLKALAADR